MRWGIVLTLIVACTLAAAAPSVAWSQSDAGQSDAGQARATKAGPKNAKPREPLAITPEREAAVATFVERNHAELAPLLAHLRSSQPRQYEQAVREIFRVTERLAGIQERDPLLYELEVKLWTAQSRVQVLAARLSMDMTDSLKEELRAALSEQIAARLLVLKHQREQASQRLARMDRDIDQLEANRQAAIDRQVEMLTRAAGGKNKNVPAKASQNRGEPNKSAAKKTESKKSAPNKTNPKKNVKPTEAASPRSEP
jgi:hypothetical protein